MKAPPILDDLVKMMMQEKKGGIMLNLGSGTEYKEGWVNIDNSPLVKADLCRDIEKGLPYGDETVDAINASHYLEHVHDLIFVMNECSRVLKPDHYMTIRVPQGDGTWCDPTHVRAFNRLSWRYFTREMGDLKRTYGITTRFEVVQIKVAENKDGGEMGVILKKEKKR